MNTQDFRKMVAARVDSKLKGAVEREADRIVQHTLRSVGTGEPVATPGSVARIRQRSRKTTHRQYAPKGSWLALAPQASRPKVAVTGQLAAALTVCEMTLGTGPAERSVITKIMVDANPDWTRVTASGCISRLVAGGRLVVVKTPQPGVSHH